MATKKRKTVRQTGDRVSRVAARVLANLRMPRNKLSLKGHEVVFVHVADLKALAASCLNQDQTKGRRK